MARAVLKARQDSRKARASKTVPDRLIQRSTRLLSGHMSAVKVFFVTTAPFSSRKTFCIRPFIHKKGGV